MFIAGGEGKFDVDPITGDVFVVGRQMFVDKKEYKLAISAKSPGVANTTTTPIQVVNVQVGCRPPQVFCDPYNVSVYENASAMSM